MLESYRKNVEDVRQISHRVQEFLDELASQAQDWSEALGIEDKRRVLERVRQDLDGRKDVVLAVVGQIKTGKSTLLNALLFDGEEVLPSAASPKTARLTVIQAGPRRKGLARFYSREEWAAIKKRAEEGDRVHSEIVEDARFQLDDAEIASLLGSEKAIDQGWEELDEYVAEDGRFANLVREAEITIPHASLDGITVVDTPGLDDPIEARERQTLDFLHKADAVIVVVSPSIRWLDAKDIDLLLNQLGSGPLRHGAVVVVASRMDALDDRQQREWAAMKSRAAGVMEEQARRRGMDADLVIESIRRVFDSKAIVEVSALAHIIARWRQGAWVPTTGRARTLEQYEAMIAKRWKQVRSPDAFLDAAGVERLREQVETLVRDRKSRILLGGAMGRIQEVILGLEQTIESRRSDAAKQLEVLQQGLEVYEATVRREQDFLERIGSGRARLKEGLMAIERDMDDRFDSDIPQWVTRARIRAPVVKTGWAAVLGPEQVRRKLMDQVEDIVLEVLPVLKDYVAQAQQEFRTLLTDGKTL